MRFGLTYLLSLVFAAGCTTSTVTVDEEMNRPAPIFPDYAGCTVPPNIAPMNFTLRVPYDKARATFTWGEESWSVTARNGQFTIPFVHWNRMLTQSVGSTISVKVSARNGGKWTGYEPFDLHVAAEPVDPYIAYRLIEPGYELWSAMGIYQRDIEGYSQTPILENNLTDGSCMNCHSFCMQDPDRMLLHLRGAIAATMVIRDGGIEKINTTTPETISALVYPSWHPGGKLVAFSVNRTRQGFHMHDPNRVEVFDDASDVVVYDTETHEIVASPLMHGTDAFESFPTFSPDGRTLYFSSAEFVPEVIENFESVRYSLCSIGFDPESRSFGDTVDTLFNARTEGLSASFPRVSPDGRHLLYTRSNYGGFAIWHKEADLWMVDLADGEHFPLTAANSDDAESYHSWSSNSRWVLFASRRLDGLYSRLFIAYVDKEGKAGRAFPVPQKDVDFYHRFMYSFNVPEFIKGKVETGRRAISLSARGDKGIDAKFK